MKLFFRALVAAAVLLPAAVLAGKEQATVVPETGVVVTVIRNPQSKAAEQYSFAEDKRNLVLFGKRL
jgi:hypothetical protein